MDKLIAAIIRSAINDNDLKYFHGPVFREHCSMVGVDYLVIKKSAVMEILKL